jgi:hypothetical protein
VTSGQDAGARLDLEEAVGGGWESTVTPRPESSGNGHHVSLAEKWMRVEWFHAVDNYDTRYRGGMELARNSIIEKSLMRIERPHPLIFQPLNPLEAKGRDALKSSKMRLH